MRYIVTGGAGFIGSNFIRYVMRTRPDVDIVNYDKLTYAGNPATVADLESNPRYTFVQGDICHADAFEQVVRAGDVVINFAAESHVDRSITSPDEFIATNVRGVNDLLKVAYERGASRFIQVSTDEVYGSILEGSFSETDILNPSSPYSSSKAGGELIALSYYKTYGLPVVVTRSSNNFGPYQFPEKVIPLFITNAMDGLPLPLYGDGMNVRDWIHVEDNCAAIDLLVDAGEPGEVYNIGGGTELDNRELTSRILTLTGRDASLITPVEDRLGHDRRYSVDTAKVSALGWRPRHDFDEALESTVAWYEQNRAWWEPLRVKKA